MSTVTESRTGVGASVQRPDGIPKVKGEFAYASDARADRMLWGATLRSPHPRAKIRSIEIGAALRVPRAQAVLTHEDVPGRKTYGLEIQDQPVLAWEDVRYQGEPIALVAADHPETARVAASRIKVSYDVLDALTYPECALAPDTPPLHRSGNLLRHVPIRHGDPDATGEVVVTGEYEVGMQDQAFLGLESGLAVPGEDTREYHHRQTFPLDENGQGDAHVTFAFAAHRAVVDVDTDLGLVRVVEIATAQDVGKAINPQAVEGQIDGGIAQGLGLALMEGIQVVDGQVRNASFKLEAPQGSRP